jgi:uncharacterized repeat protein (TIGR01451 family)
MSRIRRCMVGVPLVVLAMLVMSASADALTLGNTTAPAGSTVTACSGPSGTADALQTGTDAAYDYTVPAAGGVITSWSFNTAGATPGTPYGLIVARPAPGGYTVVAIDNEVVPSSVGSVATFTLAAPIQVQGGDVIGSVVSPTSATDCYWTGGPLTTSDVVGAAVSPGQSVGSSLTVGQTLPAAVVNVSVSLEQDEDVGVTQQVLPGSLVAGGKGAFLLSVTNGGPANAPVTFTDAVPTGLTIDSVSAGSGSCTTSGQIITCTLPGAPTIIDVVVSATIVGNYTNNATVSTALTDPNPANNASSATLDVTAVPLCHLFSLARFKLAQAKTVIRDLGCTVGKVKAEASKSIPKGEVISISPGAGKSVALGTKITIVISSGKPKKKKAKRSDR